MNILLLFSTSCKYLLVQLTLYVIYILSEKADVFSISNSCVLKTALIARGLEILSSKITQRIIATAMSER